MHPTDAVMATIRPHLITLLLISLVIGLLALTLPIYMLQVFDRILSTGSMETLIALTGIALLALFASARLEATRNAILVRSSQWIDGTLTASLLKTLPPDQAKRTCQDASLLRAGICGRGGTMLLDGPWTPIFLVPLALLHPLFALYALILAALLTGAALWLDRRDGRNVAASRLVLDQGNVALQIHAAQPTQRSLDASIGLRGNAMTLLSTSLEMTGSVTATVKGIRLGFQLLLLATGAWLVTRGALSAGGLIAALLLFARAVAPFEQMIGGLRELLAARDAWRRLAEASQRSASANSQPDQTPLKRLKGQEA
ncbi:MAG: hypothetical protein AAF739_05795 [Pseudomonadota bacterium]